MVYITKRLGTPFVMNALATNFSDRITLLWRPLTDEVIIIIIIMMMMIIIDYYYYFFRKVCIIT